MTKQIGTKPLMAALAAGVVLFSASAGMAQSKSAPHKPAGKMTAAKTVYVCQDCKSYYSAAQAKKLGYKDSMGHKLTKTSKVPAGFMDGSKMTM